MGGHGSELLCGNLEESSTVHFHDALREFILAVLLVSKSPFMSLRAGHVCCAE